MNVPTAPVPLGELSLLQPAVHFMRVTYAPTSRTWGPRTIPDHHLIYVLTGQLEAVVGGRRFRIASGECFYYGKDSVCEITSSPKGAATFYSMHFDWNSVSPEPLSEPQLLEGMRKFSRRALAGEAPDYIVDVPEYGAISIPHHFRLPGAESLLQQIHREFETREPGFGLVMRGLLGKLLTAIVRQQISGKGTGEEKRKVALALKAIEQQPDADWSASALAELCGYHPNYFAEIFKQATGQAPKAFIISLRMKRAKQLLLEELTIEAAARKMGYSSVHYFCRHFKEMTGQTPSQYKRQFSDL